jgi:prepilin-type N-terminal cleavage/methylation domain-containing protein
MLCKTYVEKSNKGFTLVELILVVAIISLLAASSAPFISRFTTVNSLEVAVDNTVGSLRKAQAYAMDGKNDTTWGVCVNSSNIRLYRGTCASPTYNEDFGMNGVTITGFTQVTFSSDRGEPSSAITITLTNSVGSRTVSMNAAGGMTIN